MQSTQVQPYRSVFRIIKMKRNCPSHRLPWSKPQDDYLLYLVDIHGEKHWKKIEQEMKERFPDFPTNGKKCRERWINIGRTGIDKNPLSELETILLLAYHHVYSNSWTSVSRKITNRSPSTLKNNFYGLIKKTAKQVSLYSKGDVIQEPSPVQFYTTLYMTALLLEMLVVKDPIKDAKIEYNKSKTPPHIAEYVYLLKVPLSLYKAYLMEVKGKCGVGKEWKCPAEIVQRLKGKTFEETLKLSEEISEVVMEYTSLPSNEAISKTLEKVLTAEVVPQSQKYPLPMPPPPAPTLPGMWVPVTHQWFPAPTFAYPHMVPISAFPAVNLSNMAGMGAPSIFFN